MSKAKGWRGKARARQRSLKSAGRRLAAAGHRIDELKAENDRLRENQVPEDWKVVWREKRGREVPVLVPRYNVDLTSDTQSFLRLTAPVAHHG